MITIVLGTRPEIIKMAPVIRACQHAGTAYSVLHTGQHYSYEMDRVFFEELELPAPHDNLDVGSGSHAGQTGKIMAGIEKILEENPPDIVLVQGDTNTVLAGALTAAKLHIPVGHVEAGLRSFDRADAGRDQPHRGRSCLRLSLRPDGTVAQQPAAGRDR